MAALRWSLLLVAACSGDGVVVTPVIDVPLNDSASAFPLDSITVSAAHEGADLDITSQTVTTGQPAPRTYAAPPPFSQLARGNRCITSADANGYDLLANDFIHADANRDGCVSEHEYQGWVRTPR